MKKLFLLLFLTSTLGCSEEKSTPGKEPIEKTLTIQNSEVLEYPLGGQPIEGGPRITTEPQNSSVSEIRSTAEGLSYFYAPEEGFSGTDVVEIIYEFHNGAEVYDSTLTRLIIKVK